MNSKGSESHWYHYWTNHHMRSLKMTVTVVDSEPCCTFSFFFQRQYLIIVLIVSLAKTVHQEGEESGDIGFPVAWEVPGGFFFLYSILFFDLHDLFQQILTWDALNSSNRPEQLFHPRIPSSVPPEILDWYKKFSLSLSGVSKITTFTFCEIESFHYSGCKGLIASTSSSCRSSGEWRKRAGGCDSWYNSLDYLTNGFVNILIELLSHSLTD